MAHVNFDVFSRDLIKSKNTNNNDDSNFDFDWLHMFLYPSY